MKRHSISLVLLVLGILTCHAQYSVLNGDLNHDGKITVEDMALMANIIVEKSTAETIESAAELSYGEPLAESAELLSGKYFNTAIKQLVNPSADCGTEDSTIKKITFRKGYSAEGVLVSSPASKGEMRAVYNEETQEVDIYVAANKLVFPQSCVWMFRRFKSVTQIDWNDFINYIDTSNVTDMSDMFCRCTSLTDLDVSNFDTSNVTDMSDMFCLCSSLNVLDVSNFNTSNVKDVFGMFSGCHSLTTLDVTHFDTSNVTDMWSFFGGCSSLITLDVSHFDTSNVTNMCQMFSGCHSLTTLDVTHFDTSNVTDMLNMFHGCSALTTFDVSHFDTGNVTEMNSMFRACESLTTLDVTNFNTNNVTNMYAIFSGCSMMSTLKLGKNFIISDECEIGWILKNTPFNLYTSYCTITCTSAIQTKLRDVDTGIDEEKIRWDIIEI